MWVKLELPLRKLWFHEDHAQAVYMHVFLGLKSFNVGLYGCQGSGIR